MPAALDSKRSAADATAKAAVVGAFLVVLAITASLFASSFGPCQLNAVLATSPIARSAVLAVVIFIAVAQANGAEMSLTMIVAATACVWLVAIAFAKSTLGFSVAAIALLFGIYVSEQYFSHAVAVAQTSREKEDLINAERAVRYALLGVVVVVLAVGVVRYAVKQRADHAGEFSWREFWLSSRKCGAGGAAAAAATE
jgi:hypothetical protein